MDLIKKALKSKTILFAIALAVLSVWQGVIYQMDIEPVTQGIIGSIIAVCVVILRVITTMPLDDKE